MQPLKMAISLLLDVWPASFILSVISTAYTTKETGLQGFRKKKKRSTEVDRFLYTPRIVLITTYPGVFWGMYQYEVTFGVINGSIVRNGLEWATVNYASLLPDERPEPESTVPNTNWTIGWNFANDGYRLMEQELKRIHSLRTASRKVHLLPRPARASLDQEDYLGICFNRFQQLPDEVRILRPPCEDAQQNRLRFQAVNASIIVQVCTVSDHEQCKTLISLQTLSLVSVAADAEIRGFDEQKCCRVALATLRTLKEIPKQFLRAFGPQIVCCSPEQG